MITLFPDQAKLIEGVANSMRAGNKRVLMQAATGSGKTIMATEILHRAMAKGSTTWFVVPRKELLRQTSKTYDNFGVRHEFIASGKPYKLCQNHIASMQTLASRLGGLNPPDMAIIDETHYGGKQLDKIINWLTGAGTYIIGLSATPKKHCGTGMDKWYDDLVLGPSVKSLIENGRLSTYKAFAPSKPDLSGIKVVAGEYSKKSMEEFFMDHGKELIGDAVNTYKKNASGMRGLTFCTSIVESQRTARAFFEAGVTAAHLDGTMSDEYRRFVIEKYAAGELMQLCSVDIMTFGFDLAAQVGQDITVECMSDLAPTKSEAKQLQKWGRVLRMKEKPALIFDHAGNFFEHGLPDDERRWTLKGREKKKRGPVEKSVEVRQCTQCFFCHDPSPKCPNCGYEYPVQSRVIKEVEGELKEITEVERKQKAKAKRMQVGKAKSYEELKAIGRERGYAPGWAYVMAKKKGLVR